MRGGNIRGAMASKKVTEFVQTVLSSYRAKLLAIALAGAFVGLVAYLFYASRAYSYLSDDPSVCINCHVMAPYYATWQHSSHQNVATCNDCHVPHNNIFNKYFFKAKDGLRHSYVFTMRNEPMAMKAIAESQHVIYDNCVRCHSQLNQEFVKTGRMTHAALDLGADKPCWECHRDVPHGGVNGLASTPNALVPYPKSPVPQWLKDLMKK